MRKYIPYRGDGSSNDFEPRKKFVNLRKLRWGLVKTTLVVLVILATITFFVLQIPENPHGEDQTNIAVLVIIWIFASILLAGIWNLNKFRKGYDVNISDKSDESEDTSDG